MDEVEKVIWKGRPSQVLNLWPLLTSALSIVALIVASVLLVQPLLLIAIVFPLAYGLWKFLQTRCRIYELTTERIRLYEGVLNQEIDEVELYRVKDSRLSRPLSKRIFGLSDLILDTSDRSHKVVNLEAVGNAIELREHIRKYVEIQRDKKRVREVDFEGEDELEFEG